MKRLISFVLCFILIIGLLPSEADAALSIQQNITLKDSKWGEHTLAAAAVGASTSTVSTRTGTGNLYAFDSENLCKSYTYDTNDPDHSPTIGGLNKDVKWICSGCGGNVTAAVGLAVVDYDGYWDMAYSSSQVRALKRYTDESVTGALSGSNYYTYSDGKIKATTLTAKKVQQYNNLYNGCFATAGQRIPAVVVAGLYKYTSERDGHTYSSVSFTCPLCNKGSSTKTSVGSDSIYRMYKTNYYGYAEVYGYCPVTDVLAAYGYGSADALFLTGSSASTEVEIQTASTETITPGYTAVTQLVLNNVTGFTYDTSAAATTLLNKLNPSSILFTNGTEISKAPPADKYSTVYIVNCKVPSGGTTLYDNTKQYDTGLTCEVQGIAGTGKLTQKVSSAVSIDINGDKSSGRNTLGSVDLQSTSSSVRLQDGTLTSGGTISASTTAYMSYLSPNGTLTVSAGEDVTLKQCKGTGAVTITAGGALKSTENTLGGKLTFKGTSATLQGDVFNGGADFNLTSSGETSFDAINFAGGLWLTHTNPSEFLIDTCNFGGTVLFRSAGVKLKNCTSTGATISTDTNCTASIVSGTYEGAPAVNSSYITVRAGTFVDTGGTKSVFKVDEESEKIVELDGDKTITTVKLANPPIVIDWGEFPGIELDIDMSAPILSVTRTNVGGSDSKSPSAPCKSVKLTISAKDPNGTNVTLYVNGTQVGSGANPTYVTGEYTSNQMVTITAVDANGNTREYVVDITNIDERAPEILSVEASTTDWTKNNVRLVVKAEDDLRLHATAYGITEVTAGTGGNWQAGRTFDCAVNATYRVWVRDSLGNETYMDVPINNIDTKAPTISSFTSNYTSGTRVLPEVGVTLRVVATDAGAGLHDKPFSWNGGGWTDDPTCVVTSDGSYNVKVRDALGNEVTSNTITLSNAFATNGPTINSWAATYSNSVGPGGTMRKGMATLTVSAVAGHAALATAPYSYDGGATWTASTSMSVYANGYYTVLVRDVRGTTTASTLIVADLDNEQPGGYITLVKAAPDDNGDGNPDTSAYPDAEDWIYWLKVTAYDNDQVYSMTPSWTGVEKTGVIELKVPVEEPGTYSVIVRDRAGNELCLERTVTSEAIGEGGGGGGNGWTLTIGVIGDPFMDGSLGNLVYGELGVYDRAANDFTAWASYMQVNGEYGIRVDFEVESKSNRTLTGEASFAGVTDTTIFNDEDAGEISTLSEISGREVKGTAFFPISELIGPGGTNIANGRIVISLKEFNNDGELVREGSKQLYTSVQKDDPLLTYSYNRTLKEVTVTAHSAVAGIREIKYGIGAANTTYNPATPIDVSVYNGTQTLVITVWDNCGNETTLPIDMANIEDNINRPESLPTQENTDESLNVYYIGGRTSEIYVIGGTQSNTDQIPTDDILTP